MRSLMYRLVLILARMSPEEMVQVLLRKIEFLQAEKEILRSRLTTSFRATPAERTRLLQLGKAVGWPGVKELITVITPRTFARWLTETKKTRAKTKRGPGRPRKPLNLRELVLKFARENLWGYSRIMGELHKLTTGKISKSTVRNILQENGFDPSPRRGQGTWAEFLSSHAQTLWACDFFSQPVLTFRGWVDCYIILFIHVDSRRIFVTPATVHPTGAWVTQQARNFLLHVEDQGMQFTHLIRDNDGKFPGVFDATLESTGAKVVTTAIRAPNMNAFAERAVQTLQVECLDKFLILGQGHLNYLIQEFVTHYHHERPHQGKGNVTLTPEVAPEVPPPPNTPRSTAEALSLRAVGCRTRLGGVLKHYYHRAA